ncbi:MAG: hypothetical protein K2J82_00315 [Muribaculaceae bacterium]|nr:hypothetical protein [Muribaculaceae bacterium]
MSDLTDITFPEVVFIDGAENRYVGGNSKEYKLLISSSKGKKKLLEEIKKDILGGHTDWAQTDTNFSFIGQRAHSEVTNNGMGNPTLIVNITIPRFSNDTIYVEERLMNNTPRKTIE